jgi:hypothetical protein
MLPAVVEWKHSGTDAAAASTAVDIASDCPIATTEDGTVVL